MGAPRGTFRLWDKDFNLLAKWEEGQPLFATVERDDGSYWSGYVEFTGVNYVPS